jgi:hypothetical protein
MANRLYYGDHRSATVVRRYIRDGELFANRSAEVGL